MVCEKGCFSSAKRITTCQSTRFDATVKFPTYQKAILTYESAGLNIIWIYIIY